MASYLPVQKGFDVFNALDLMENKTFLEKLKFGIGDGNLQYYLYNWKCPSMAPEKVSAVRRGLVPTALGTGVCCHPHVSIPAQLVSLQCHSPWWANPSAISRVCRACPWGKPLHTRLPKIILFLD